MNLPPLPLPILRTALPSLPVLAMPPLPAPTPARAAPWPRSPDQNPTKAGWYITRWRTEFPESRLYWDGVWWCCEIENATGARDLQRLAHVNIKNWSCEWRAE